MAKRHAQRPRYAQHKPLCRIVELVRRLKVCSVEGAKPRRLSPAARQVAAAIEGRARTQSRHPQIFVGFGGTKHGRAGSAPRQQPAGLAEETAMSRRSVIYARRELERHGVLRVVIGGRKGKGGRGLANAYRAGPLLGGGGPEGLAAPVDDDAAYLKEKADWLEGLAQLHRERAAAHAAAHAASP